jgi:hypothetical protein
MAVTVEFFDHFMKMVGNGSINLATDTLKAMLVSGYTYDSAHTLKADVVASELGNGLGYNTGGQALTSVSFDFLSNNTILDADNSSWTASGGDIGPFSGAIIYSDTSLNDMLVCYIDFGGSQLLANGFTLLLAYHVGGLCVITK